MGIQTVLYLAIGHFRFMITEFPWNYGISLLILSYIICTFNEPNSFYPNLICFKLEWSYLVLSNYLKFDESNLIMQSNILQSKLDQPNLV